MSGGQIHESKAAIELLSGVDIAGSHILADKAYEISKRHHIVGAAFKTSSNIMIYFDISDFL